MTTTSACKYCGEHLDADSKFCGECGTALSATLLPLAELRELLTAAPVKAISTGNQARTADSTTGTEDKTAEANSSAYQAGKIVGSFVADQSFGTSSAGNKIAKWLGIVLGALVVFGVGIAVVAEMFDRKTSTTAQVSVPAIKPTQNQPLPKGQSNNAVPGFAPNESYASVRQKLLASGWQPFHASDADVCSQGDARCQGRPEMQACAGTGMANCRFIWQKDGKTVAVMTVGEDAAFAGIEPLNTSSVVPSSYVGVVVAPREQGDQYTLKLASPVALSGDADCGQQQKDEIELWDEPSKLKPYAGKTVAVDGQLDCPRGGYGLRSVTLSVK